MDVGLVLGGGGARGYAHIGVLRALSEHDCQPVAISGCSMGGLIGAFFAAGFRSDDILALIEDTNFLNLLDMGVRGGLLGSGKLEKLLRKHLPERFDDLTLPLAVTCVDVQQGELVVLRQGDLVSALLASAALPGILAPVLRDGRYLIDGGLLNNLPVDVIKTMTLAPVIAVDVSAPPNRKLAFVEDDTNDRFQGLFSGGASSEAFSSAFSEAMQGLADNFKGMFSPAEWFKRSLTIELFMKSFDVPQAVLTEMRLALQPPALLIQPALDLQFGVEDFERLEEGVDAGYQAATALLADFVQSL
jgi:NTE family protein